MDKSAAHAFVFAKASGMLSKSFVGNRFLSIFQEKKLQDLWKLLFEDEVPLLPEYLLAQTIEKKAEEVFVSDFTQLLSYYAKPDPVLVQLLQVYEYNNLKLISSALMNNKTQMPDIIDLESFAILDYSKWPDIKKMTENTVFAWYDTIPKVKELKTRDHALDVQYIRSLWASVQRLPAAERAPVQAFIKEDIVIQNILWALRLKYYYGYDAEAIIPFLAGLKDSPDEKDVLAGPAVQILDKEIDSFADWKDWEYRRFLNRHEPDEIWSIDPKWVAQAAEGYLTKKALKNFRKYPFTAMVLVCWFKVKQAEVSYVRTAVQALRLNVSEEELSEYMT